MSNPPPTHADDPHHSSRWISIETYSFTAQPGTNEIIIEAVNYKNPLNAYSNPAGAIYNAEISFNREIQAPEFISPLVAAAILLVSPAFAYLLIKKRARPP